MHHIVYITDYNTLASKEMRAENLKMNRKKKEEKKKRELQQQEICKYFQ